MQGIVCKCGSYDKFLWLKVHFLENFLEFVIVLKNKMCCFIINCLRPLWYESWNGLIFHKKKRYHSGKTIDCVYVVVIFWFDFIHNLCLKNVLRAMCNEDKCMQKLHQGYNIFALCMYAVIGIQVCLFK